MSRWFAVVALTSLFALPSCVTWPGQGAGLTEEQLEKGYKDPVARQRAYDNERFYGELRRRWGGWGSAMERDFAHIRSTIDRHFFNFSDTDPLIDYDSQLGLGTATLRGTTTALGSVPVLLR
ncbi:MAG: hypothetical protein IT458_10170 [Planctomycetes bacterium]|nr:hypothetical protein [Planctomycetota bacterium]